MLLVGTALDKLLAACSLPSAREVTAEQLGGHASRYSHIHEWCINLKSRFTSRSAA